MIKGGLVADSAGILRPHDVALLQSKLNELSLEQPELMSLFYPRVYRNIGSHHSPKRLSQALVFSTVTALQSFAEHGDLDLIPTADKLLLPALLPLAERNMPMYFLGGQFLDAILKSRFDEDIDWVNMKLPMEHGIFVLPKDYLVHPKDGQVGFIFWSRVPEAEYLPVTALVRRYRRSLPKILTKHSSMALVAYLPDSGIWYDANLTETYRPTFKIGNIFYADPGELVQLEKASPWDESLTPADSEFLEKISAVAFGSLLAMLAKPTLVEAGQLVARSKSKVDGRIKETWDPNFVGRKFVIRGLPQGGTHRSPRAHWRIGHFRTQRFGSGLKESKIIWIEPQFVNAETQKPEIKG